jgi:ketosteroid isomerase-like protein
MNLTKEYVHKIFSFLEKGQNKEFFNNVAENVKWTVMGTHPLAGVYNSKSAFIAATFDKLAKVLEEGVVLKIDNILISEPYAIVEMHALSHVKDGGSFNNTYCWITKFKEGIIIEVRAYLDSALVAKVMNLQP